MKDIIAAIKKDPDFPKSTRIEAINRFRIASHWGLFDDKEGTPIDVLVKGGQVTVLDVSAYATGEGGRGVRALVIGLIARKLFIERMISRKKEEVEAAWDIVQQIPVDLRQTDIKSALSIAITFNLYAYDAYFLRCAENLHSPLLTLDLGMQRVAREMGIKILE